MEPTVNSVSMFRTAGLVLAFALVAGCYRPVDVTVYEPGVYKGAADPLLKMHAQPEQKAALQERFSLVQADR